MGGERRFLLATNFVVDVLGEIRNWFCHLEARGEAAFSLRNLNGMVLVSEPPVVSREPNNSKVEEGGEVELECEVRGTPTPKVMWLLNGEPLDNDTHAHIRGLAS